MSALLRFPHLISPFALTIPPKPLLCLSSFLAEIDFPPCINYLPSRVSSPPGHPRVLQPFPRDSDPIPAHPPVAPIPHATREPSGEAALGPPLPAKVGPRPAARGEPCPSSLSPALNSSPPIPPAAPARPPPGPRARRPTAALLSAPGARSFRPSACQAE